MKTEIPFHSHLSYESQKKNITSSGLETLMFGPLKPWGAESPFREDRTPYTESTTILKQRHYSARQERLQELGQP